MSEPRPGGDFINLDAFDVRPDHANGSLWYIQQNPMKRFGFELKDGRCVYPTDGFQIDGASIPRACWRWIGPPTGFGKHANYMAAAAIHDWLYQMGQIEGYWITRQLADRVFYVACRRLNVSGWRCVCMYTALRIGGGSYWASHKHGKPGTPVA